MDIIKRVDEEIYDIYGNLIPRGTYRVHVGRMPHGGVKEVGFFYDKQGFPCQEKDAETIQVIEYNEKDEPIFSIISMPQYNEFPLKPIKKI